MLIDKKACQNICTGRSRKITLENNRFFCYQQYFLWTTKS